MNSAKKRLIAVISLIALTLTGCGMDAETEKGNVKAPVYGAGASASESNIEPVTTEQTIAATTNVATSSKNKISDTSESIKPKATTASINSSATQEETSKKNIDSFQQPSISDVTQDEIERIAETTNTKTETETTNTETVIHSDSAMYDENDNEIPTYIPKTDPVIIAGDGNVTLIGTLQEQMGKEPLRVSKEESEMLISMLNEIELQPVDSPDRASIPFGGGYIMNIEGGERYILLGGRYLQIGDKYYYDANDKSDDLSAKIGYVLYDYYGEP